MLNEEKSISDGDEEQKDLPKPQTNLPTPEKETTDQETVVVKNEEPKKTFPVVKILITIIIVLLIIMSLGAAYFILNQNKTTNKITDTEVTQEEQDKLSEYKTIENNEGGFSFDVPSSAKLTYDDSAGSYLYKIKPDVNSEKLGINVHNYGSGALDIQELENEIISGDSHTTEQIEIKKSYLNIDGFNALKYEYIPNDSNTVTVVFINSNKVANEFEISAYAPDQESLNTILPLFESIIQSFQFSDQDEIIDTSSWKTFTNTNSINNQFSISHPNNWFTKEEILDDGSIYTLSINNVNNKEYSIIIYQAPMGGGGCVFAGEVPEGPYSDLRDKEYVEIDATFKTLRRIETTNAGAFGNNYGFSFCQGNKNEDIFSSPTQIGQLSYYTPQNPDLKILSDMDGIVKTITIIN